MIKRRKYGFEKAGPPLARVLMAYIRANNIRYFKNFNVRGDCKTGLTKQQVTIATKCLRDEGLIEKTGGPNSAWRVLEPVIGGR